MVRCGFGSLATFLVAVLAGLAGPATAQVVELFRSFQEDPLSEAAEFVAACSLGEFTVTVEAGLRDRKITLMLKGETPAEALKAIAKRILAEKAVTVKLAKASLKKAVQTLKEKGGLPIRLDPAAEKAVAGRTFDADLADVPLGEALGAIFLPRGFDVAAEEAGLVVRPLP